MNAGKRRSVQLALLGFILPLCIGAFPPSVLAASEVSLEQAKWFFQHEDYEEALAILDQLRLDQPRSSEIAYYAGLTYKRLQDYVTAKTYLEAAVMLEPEIKAALPELIDVLYQTNKIEEAKRWISVAEGEQIAPAQVAFFKGLVLLKEADDLPGARAAFTRAQELDPALSASVGYYQAMVYMQEKRFSQAQKEFREIIVKDPSTSLAAFAGEYLDMLQRRQEAMQPFHANVSVALQYDDNVVLKPDNEAVAGDISDESDWRYVYASQGEYRLKTADNFGLNIGYSVYNSKQDSIGFYDALSVNLPVQPTFYFKNASLAFPINYNTVSVHGKKYEDSTGLGLVNNVMLDKDMMYQLQLQYNLKDFRWAADPEDNKDANEYSAAVGWYYFFTKDQKGFLNVRYANSYDDAKGSNWRYRGNRLTLSSVTPLAEQVKWICVGDYARQDYLNEHSVYNKQRHDDIYTVSNLFTYEFMKNIELQLQHTFMYDGASIGVYKYRKNVYSVGLKSQF